MATWDRIRESRRILSRKLEQLGLRSWPSQTNFILVQIPDDPGAKHVYEKLKLDNILVRHFDVNNLKDKIRITIGSEDENKRLISSLEKILKI
jgi:histidinol-phosphate aminotransferase